MKQIGGGSVGVRGPPRRLKLLPSPLVPFPHNEALISISIPPFDKVEKWILVITMFGEEAFPEVGVLAEVLSIKQDKQNKEWDWKVRLQERVRIIVDDIKFLNDEWIEVSWEPVQEKEVSDETWDDEELDFPDVVHKLRSGALSLYNALYKILVVFEKRRSAEQFHAPWLPILQILDFSKRDLGVFLDKLCWIMNIYRICDRLKLQDILATAEHGQRALKVVEVLGAALFKLHDVLRDYEQAALKPEGFQEQFGYKIGTIVSIREPRRRIMDSMSGIVDDAQINGLSSLDHTRMTPFEDKLERFLNSTIIGQQHPVRTVVRALGSSDGSLRDRRRPIGCYLFTGPSGVGKTETVRRLAEYFFGKQDSFKRIDGSGLAEGHSISRLIGSPAGYVGSRGSNEELMPELSQWEIDRFAFEASPKAADAGMVHENIQNTHQEIKSINERIRELRRKRQISGSVTREIDLLFGELKRLEKQLARWRQAWISLYSPEDRYLSLILLDEIEKAHHQVHKLFLPILDDAVLQLNSGWGTTNFSNSLIIATSNLGWEKIKEEIEGGKIGFSSGFQNDADKVAEINDRIYQEVNKEVGHFFETSFLSRLDGIEVFRLLTMDQLGQVLDLQMSDIQMRFGYELYMYVQMTQRAREWLLRESTDRPSLGARLVRQKLDSHVRKPLDRLVTIGQVQAGDIVVIDYTSDHELDFRCDSSKRSDVIERFRQAPS